MKIKLSVTFPNEIIKAFMEEQGFVTENEALAYLEGFYRNEFWGTSACKKYFERKDTE